MNTLVDWTKPIKFRKSQGKEYAPILLGSYLTRPDDETSRTYVVTSRYGDDEKTVWPSPWFYDWNGLFLEGSTNGRGVFDKDIENFSVSRFVRVYGGVLERNIGNIAEDNAFNTIEECRNYWSNLRTDAVQPGIAILEFISRNDELVQVKVHPK